MANDYSYKVARTFSRISTSGSRTPPLLASEPDDFYLHGAVVVPAVGVVLVYSQRGSPHTSLSFLHEGRMHQRSLKRFYTALGLARVAAAFAREIAATWR